MNRVVAKRIVHVETALHFFPSTPVLLSSAEDNSVKQWTLDVQSKELRLLRQRSGPRNPPFSLHFYDEVRVIAPPMRCTQRHALGFPVVDVRQRRSPVVPLHHSGPTEQGTVYQKETRPSIPLTRPTSGTRFLLGEIPAKGMERVAIVILVA